MNRIRRVFTHFYHGMEAHLCLFLISFGYPGRLFDGDTFVIALQLAA
jgi:hypothetical protein